jgi:hypothetical protein
MPPNPRTHDYLLAHLRDLRDYLRGIAEGDEAKAPGLLLAAEELDELIGWHEAQRPEPPPWMAGPGLN